MQPVTENKINIDTWQLSTAGEKLYSADAVIDAYLKGKKEGLEQSQKAQIQLLECNIQKASVHTVKVLDFLKAHGITPLSAHLKLDRFDVLEVLITCSEKDFLSDNIVAGYNYVASMEEAVSEELYAISFSFIDQGAGFNESLLKSDGYLFKKNINSKASA